MLPALQTDTTTKATEFQVLQALASLGGLPSRQADDDGIDRQMYLVALSGVTRYALSEAVKAASQGRHGSKFFPNTAELRMLCDEAQAPVDRMAERARQIARQAEERRIAAQYAALRTPQAKAKATAAYAKFCESYEKPEEKPSTWLDPELVAKVPDAPASFKQARVG